MRITESHLRNVIRSELKATLLEMGGGKSMPILEEWKVEGNKVIPIVAYYSMERELYFNARNASGNQKEEMLKKLTPIPPIPLDNMTKGEKHSFGSYVLMRFVEGNRPIEYILKKSEKPEFNTKLDEFVAANPM